MRFLNILFYILYSFSYRTNKSIPEWSTIITISILLTFNLISFSLLFEIPILGIGKNGFKFLPVLFIILNWFYFIRGSRYIKIIDNPPVNKKKSFYGIISILYIILSIAFLFFMLDTGFGYFLFTIFSLAIIMLIAYFVGSR